MWSYLYSVLSLLGRGAAAVSNDHVCSAAATESPIVAGIAGNLCTVAQPSTEH